MLKHKKILPCVVEEKFQKNKEMYPKCDTFRRKRINYKQKLLKSEWLKIKMWKINDLIAFFFIWIMQ